MCSKREDALYAEGLRYSQEGHALWPKVLSNDMKPGACGYFNGDGDWITVVQLTDLEAVQQLMTAVAPGAPARNEANKQPLDVGPLKNLKVTAVGGSTDWSEKTSPTIRRQAVDLQGTVIPSGAAATFKAGIQYTCISSRGAILVARPPISCCRLTAETDLIHWVEENIEALAHKCHWPSVKQRGLWVIRKTYHAPQCAKHVFRARDENVTLHVGAKVSNLGNATASAAWWNASHVDSGWTVHRSTEESKEKTEKGETSSFTQSAEIAGPGSNESGNKADRRKENIGVVMFFGGIWWRRGRLLSRKFVTEEEQARQDVLGGDAEQVPSVFVRDPLVTADDSEEAFLELCPGVVGDDLPSDGLPKYDDSFEMYD